MRIALICICFLIGYLTTLGFGILHPNAFAVAFTIPISQYHEMRDLQKSAAMPYNEFFYFPERTPTIGTTIQIPEKSYKGYTFYVSIDDLKIKLINMDGKIIHEWYKSPKEIWTDPKHIAQKTKPEHFTSTRAFLDPATGNVYTFFGNKLKSPASFGLVKLDKNSNVIWKYDGFIHHDINFSEDKKTIYALGKVPTYEPVKGLENIPPPFLDEEIVILDNNGKEIKKISFMKLFMNSQLKNILEHISGTPADPSFYYGDIFHSNTIEPIPDEAVGKAPMLKKGHLMLSFRNLDLLVIIDPETEKVTWASYGPWKGQHDPEIQPDGSVIMFDNLGNLKKDGGPSRILQVDLNTMGIMWEYDGTKENEFFSPYNSSIQILPNNNILVTESHAGRIFEITRDKEIVWEFWNPKRRIIKESKHGAEYNNTSHIASIFSGVRYSKEDMPFLETKKQNK